ncbi:MULTISPECIES: hypothetical protein [unclassified Roseobacter]|uniref:hypothetical protein n=1 Tax=unclassified Roseobacter TaxID=196798 RepID=UPI0014913275|nr:MULTISPECIES: hypothetical protein [unclassified Roseobacter]NNY51143.1 hypothetical protein [Roseobacter sp. HKCCD8190]NNZ44620.1 hypothetical protein [Roseobacter sp. HKCCD9051]
MSRRDLRLPSDPADVFPLHACQAHRGAVLRPIAAALSLTAVMDFWTRQRDQFLVWQRTGSHRAAPQLGRCLFVTDPFSSTSTRLASILSDYGYDVELCDVDLCSDGDASFEFLLGYSDSRTCSLFVFDLDFLRKQKPLGEVVDCLITFREQVCRVPNILLSSSFGRDDFGVDRLPIADASLRLPVARGRIAAAIAEARTNNALWQRRLEDRSLQQVMTGGGALCVPKAGLQRPRARRQRSALRG